MSACFCVLNIRFLAWQMIRELAAQMKCEICPLYSFIYSVPDHGFRPPGPYPVGAPSGIPMQSSRSHRETCPRVCHGWVDESPTSVLWTIWRQSQVRVSNLVSSVLKQLDSSFWNKTVITLSTVLSPCVNSSSTVLIQMTNASKI